MSCEPRACVSERRRQRGFARAPPVINKANPPLALSEIDVAVLVAQHATFRRFLLARLGNPADTDDVLQRALLQALARGGSLRRGERVVAWFYRALRNALVDHFQRKQADARRAERVLNELRINGSDVIAPAAEWDAAVCTCFAGLLPLLKPRYAELIRRVDLDGELKVVAMRELKLSSARFDLVLHRARSALRRRLEIFCEACSCEKCLVCAGGR